MVALAVSLTTDLSQVTDDTDAINRALNTTRARTLFFPAGSYMISAPLTVGYDHAGGGVRIVGEGMYTTGECSNSRLHVGLSRLLRL